MSDRLRLWIVEDDARFRDTLALYVAHTDGLALAGASESVEEAEAALARHTAPVEAVVLDLRLPGASGLDGLLRLRPLVPDAAFVILTLHDDPDQIFTALERGASGYVLKSAPLSTLVATVRSACAGGMLLSPPVARRVQAHFQAARAALPELHLAPREREVLSAMAEGLVQKEIAARLGVSPSTVDTYVQRLYDRLHVRTATGAVARGIRERLI